MSARMTQEILVTIQPKEETTSEGAEPGYPSAYDLESRLRDILGDVTKHDGMIGWRIVDVEV